MMLKQLFFQFDPFTLFGIVIVAALVLFLLNILTSIWAYRDSQRKGNSREFNIIVLLGTLFFPIIGLIAYLIIRYEG